MFSHLRDQINKDPLFHTLAKKLGFEPTINFPNPLDAPAFLKALFATELEQEVIVARELGVTSHGTIEKRKWRKYEELTTDNRSVVTRAFRAIEASGRFILLAFDNADQLALDYQLEIFLFAQHLAADTGSNIVVALREEKFYLASQHGAFNAFHTHAFHIPSPSLRLLLSLRLNYAIEHLDKILPDSDRRAEAHDYLDAIRRGGVGTADDPGSSNVVRLLERICQGNMRRALLIFRGFLQSGNTYVDKIIGVYRDNISQKGVPYYVPFHEFVKSVMLGERRFYRESQSEIVNLFAISGHSPNSHFTSLRILTFLLHGSERGSSFGKGFVEVEEILQVFSGVFPDSIDCEAHLRRLLKAGLVEPDTGVSDDLSRCTAVRAAAPGEYYFSFLVRAFAYLDLVFMDTPIADSAVFTRLRELFDRRDKEGRFERVDLLLRYLSEEESREYRSYVGLSKIAAWSEPTMPGVIAQIEKEKGIIEASFARAAARDRPH